MSKFRHLLICILSSNLKVIHNNNNNLRTPTLTYFSKLNDLYGIHTLLCNFDYLYNRNQIWLLKVKHFIRTFCLSSYRKNRKINMCKVFVIHQHHYYFYFLQINAMLSQSGMDFWNRGRKGDSHKKVSTFS